MQHPFSRLRVGSGANIFNKSWKKCLLHKNEDLEIVLGALLTFDKLAFLLRCRALRWLWWKHFPHSGVANEWEQRLVTCILVWCLIIFNTVSRSSEWRMTIRKPLLSRSWLQTWLASCLIVCEICLSQCEWQQPRQYLGNRGLDKLSDKFCPSLQHFSC